MARGSAETSSLADVRSHNVPPATFLSHYRTIRKLKDDHADTGMALARAKKAAKEVGIDLDALKMLEKLSAMDIDEAELQLKNLRQYAAWIELPIGSQIDMFGKDEPAKVDADAAAEQREWQAGDDGGHAGRAGHERIGNPHQQGSAEYVAWDKGWVAGNKIWMKGQASIAAEMAPEDEAGNGAEPPRRRGRRQEGATASLV